MFMFSSVLTKMQQLVLVQMALFIYLMYKKQPKNLG